MKTLVITVPLACWCLAAAGQGVVQFRNYFLNATPPIDAPVYLDVLGGQRLDGSNTLWRAALLGGPPTGQPASFQAPGNLLMLYSPTVPSVSWVNFRSGTNPPAAPGYVNTGATVARVVPGVDWGGTALIQMVAWEGNYTNWADAWAAAQAHSDVRIGCSKPLTLTLPSGPTSPFLTYLWGLQPFAIRSAIGGPTPTFTNLHNFCGMDGNWPQAGLLSSGDTLYGATVGGTVFRIKTDGSGFIPLCSFYGTNGDSPCGELALSGDTLYGPTAYGGASDRGTVFRVKTDGTGFATLHEFNGVDGAVPVGGLVHLGNNLYGTTQNGGYGENGTLFRLGCDGTGFLTLHRFQGGDGSHPFSKLTLYSGCLYGTTIDGGLSGKGTIFLMNTDGTGFTSLHHFAGRDGRNPYSGLLASGGALYGTTLFGGAYDLGTVFKVNADATIFSTLYSFNGREGYCPYATPVLAGKTLYGTTSSGGSGLAGVLFAIDVEESFYAELYDFEPLVGGINGDGANPYAGLVLSEGMLFGTSPMGGTCGGGTLFALPLPTQVAPPVQTTELGTSAAFCLMPVAARPAFCQWLFNGAPVSGATNPVLILEGVHFEQAGAYAAVYTNLSGAVVAGPAILSVIPQVERRTVPLLNIAGQAGTPVNLEFASSVGQQSAWSTFDTVTLTNAAQWYFDSNAPVDPARFYRAWQMSGTGEPMVLGMHLAPAITLRGSIGSSVRIDYINQVGPTNAWQTLATVTLTATTQEYYDTSAIGQSTRLYRLVIVP